jgi:hypothetical protein
MPAPDPPAREAAGSDATPSGEDPHNRLDTAGAPGGDPPGGLDASGPPPEEVLAAGPASGARPPGLAGITRYRSVLLAGVFVAAAFVVAVIYALFSAGGNAGAVPGSDAIASLAAIPSGFLVGTTGGLAESADGRSWAVAHLPTELVAVSSNASTAFVLAGGELRSTTDLHTFAPVAAVAGTVIAAGADGSVDVVGSGGRRISHVAPGGVVTTLPSPRSQPTGIFAMAVSPVADGTIWAGGPVSGLWRTQDGGASWQLLDRIPVQALLVDPAHPEDLYVGTVGGLFASTDGGLRWQPTQLRNDVTGLAEAGGRFYAVGSDRLIYASPNGTTGWAAVAG